jgi:hypothetical protein
MQEIIAIIYRAFLDRLGEINRTERRADELRKEAAKAILQRDEALAKIKEFIGFLDLNDKEWRSTLEPDQAEMLTRVQELFLVNRMLDTIAKDPMTIQVASDETYESLGFVGLDIVKRLRVPHPMPRATIRIISRALYEEGEDDDEFAEIFVKVESK